MKTVIALPSKLLLLQLCNLAIIQTVNETDMQIPSLQ